MISLRHTYRAAVAVAAIALSAPMALAQQAVAPAGEVLARMGQAVGLVVVADATVTEAVTPPALPTTMENLEAQIAGIVATLPAGTTWARVYLPAPPADRKWTGDSVAAYIKAQAGLFGTVGGATPAGTVEVMGRQIPEAKAAEVIATLGLKPVYLVTNPQKAAAAAAARQTTPFGSLGTLGGAAQWGEMTPEQRQAYAKSAASDIINADPAVQRQMFEQQMSVMREVMTQMPPDQRRALFEGIRSQMGPRPGNTDGNNAGQGRGRRGNRP